MRTVVFSSLVQLLATAQEAHDIITVEIENNPNLAEAAAATDDMVARLETILEMMRNEHD